MTGETTPNDVERDARQLNRMIDEKIASKGIGLPAHLADTDAVSSEEEDDDEGTGPSNTLDTIRGRSGSTFRTMEDIGRENTPLENQVPAVATPGLNLHENAFPRRGIPMPRGVKRNNEMNVLGGIMTEMLDVFKGKRDQAINAANECRMSSLEDAFRASTAATNASFSLLQQQVRKPFYLNILSHYKLINFYFLLAQMAAMTEAITVLVAAQVRIVFLYMSKCFSSFH